MSDSRYELNQQLRTRIARKHQVKKLKNAGKRIPRNEPCPCGSGTKYKKCCGE